MKIDKVFLNKMKQDFNKDRAFRVAQRAASSNGIIEASLDKKITDSNRFTFNVDLTETKIRNQKQSARCWIFAAMNVMEYKLAQKFNLKEFELSQNYIYFHDKLERCNYFFNSIKETFEEDEDSRILSFLLSMPMNDGGQWDMIKNIINKYGIVPNYEMPDTKNSLQSAPMNNYLTKILRMYAKDLRNAHKDGKSEIELNSMIEEYMKNIYNVLCIALGTPPETVNFETRDKDNNFISHTNLTPIEFFELVDMNLDDYVSLINAPTKDKPFYKAYTVEHLGNVLEGDIVKYVNVTIEDMKTAVKAQLMSAEPVWFGCDVGQFFSRTTGRLDLETVNVFDMLNINYDFSKAERLDYKESLMTHAMVFMGLNEEGGKINRYKVENTWGSETGINGYLVMSDEWFNEYMYQVLINKKYLNETILNAYDSEPIVLRPWDPMGSLA
ncbi:MAG: C1 family peptidase [Helcococcus sp.]|nr:C1 family peptidase [Helcococcus sp.]